MHFKTKNSFKKDDKEVEGGGGGVEGEKAFVRNEPSNDKILAMRNILKEDLAFRLSGSRDSNTLVANEKTVKKTLE